MNVVFIVEIVVFFVEIVVFLAVLVCAVFVPLSCPLFVVEIFIVLAVLDCAVFVPLSCPFSFPCRRYFCFLWFYVITCAYASVDVCLVVMVAVIFGGC